MENFPAFKGNIEKFERSGAIKDIYQGMGGDFVVKKFADIQDEEKRTVQLEGFSYQITPYSWPDDEPDVSTYEFAKNRRSDYETLSLHLGDFVLDSYYLIAKDENNQPATFEIQEKIEGRTLSQITEIESDKIKGQLEKFALRSLMMFEVIGWLPDIHEDLTKTDNIIVDSNDKMRFIDNDAIYKIPDDLLEKYQDQLYDEEGLNPNLLKELKSRGYSSRYASGINETIQSFLNHIQDEVSREIIEKNNEKP